MNDSRALDAAEVLELLARGLTNKFLHAPTQTLNAADAVVPPDVRIGSDYVRTQSEYALGEGGFTFHSGGRELVYGRFEHEDAFVTITGKWSDEPSDEEPRPDAGRAPCKVDTSSEVELGHATGADVTGTPMFPLVGPTFVTYDDRRSRKRVLELDVYAGDVSVTFAAGKATLRGEGCSDVLTLP